ncbi:MAG: hypothetical protein PWP24_1689 [Clostridiales bacterium]|nr:hypothetical protein [Clostridiales bacterium]
MKKHILFISNVIIILVIVTGFFAVVYQDSKNYQELGERYLENIVSLADTNISKQIENAMIKPIMVSKTMANDEFLKGWILHESEHGKDSEYLNKLYNYLKAYQEKYGYSTVFCIPAKTQNYYYQEGFNKKLSTQDDHDIWYYNFIQSKNEYDLEIDTNEQDQDTITVFVNFRIDDEEGNILGVIGVGLEIVSFEDTIQSYERDYDLSVYIVNVHGVATSFNKETDIFVKEDKLSRRTGIQNKIKLSPSDQAKIQWYTSKGKRKCLITTYDASLGWYLVLEKDTSTISRAFQVGIKNNMLVMLMVMGLCILVTTVVFINCNQRLIAIENIDELTGLMSRKLFSRRYPTFLRKHRKDVCSVFMMDVDAFKSINDTYGHIYGNVVLTMIGKHLKEMTAQDGIACRWGGDEFLGVLALDQAELETRIHEFMEALEKEGENLHHKITVSVGIISVNEKINEEEMMKKADKAMYHSKKNGKNHITVL